jgi:hypothetical protein
MAGLRRMTVDRSLRYLPGCQDPHGLDGRAYRKFVGVVIWRLPGVRETRTCAVMAQTRHSARIAL